VIFSGLKLTPHGIWVGSTSTDGSNAGHHIRLINLEIDGTGADATSADNLVNVNRFGHDVEVIGGSFHHAPASSSFPACAAAGTYSCYAFYITGKNNILDHVQVHDNPSYGVHIYSGYSERADNNIVRYSEFYNNGTAGGQVSAALLLSSGDNNQGYGNIIRDNYNDGIHASNSGTNTKVYSNTVVNNNRNGSYYGGIAWGTGSGTIIKNNIVYSNRGADLADTNGTQTPTFSNNLCTNSGPGCARGGNPLFFDPTNYNYNLQPGSPAIDSGTTLSDIPPYDMSGTLRPQAASWDIGAYEYH
jgi:hypothetical protein